MKLIQHKTVAALQSAPGEPFGGLPFQQLKKLRRRVISDAAEGLFQIQPPGLSVRIDAVIIIQTEGGVGGLLQLESK